MEGTAIEIGDDGRRSTDYTVSVEPICAQPVQESVRMPDTITNDRALVTAHRKTAISRKPDPAIRT